jgi:hypothetical protein
MVIETGNSILLPGNSAIEAIAITPDGKHVYVPSMPGSTSTLIASQRRTALISDPRSS